MGKYFAIILLLTFLISYPTYCQYDLHQLLNQEFGAGIGLSGTDLWTQVGGNLYYGLSPGVTGHIFGSVRLPKKDPLLSAFDIDFSPSPGVGIGVSSRNFSGGSNIGYWASGFVGRRWAKAEQTRYQKAIIKGHGTGLGFAGGIIGRVITQTGATFFPFAGPSYSIDEVSWEGSLVAGVQNERYTDLGGVIGMEARIENISLLGFVNFSLEGGGTNFTISSFFHLDDSKLFQTPRQKKETKQGDTELTTEQSLTSKGDYLFFNGKDNYVEIPDHPRLSGGPKRSLTVEAWVYPMSYGDKERRCVISKYLGWNTKDWGIFLEINGKEPQQKDGVVAFQKEGRGNWYTWSSEAIPLNKWTHIAAVFDNNANTLRLYINGKPKGSRNLVGDLPKSNAAVWIGGPGRFY